MQKFIKKSFVFIQFIMILNFVFMPTNVVALTKNNSAVEMLVPTSSSSPKASSSTNMDSWMDEYGHEQTCEGSNSLLGNVNDENSVAWLLQQVLNYIKILGPVLVVVLSSIDFTKVIVKSDDEAMGKAQKKLGKRLILAGLLFFIPTLVQVIFNIFDITTNVTCGIK